MTGSRSSCTLCKYQKIQRFFGKISGRILDQRIRFSTEKQSTQSKPTRFASSPARSPISAELSVSDDATKEMKTRQKNQGNDEGLTLFARNTERSARPPGSRSQITCLTCNKKGYYLIECLVKGQDPGTTARVNIASSRSQHFVERYNSL